MFIGRIFLIPRATVTRSLNSNPKTIIDDLLKNFTSVKFLSKTSIIVFGFELSDLVTVALGIKKMRPINIFTGRGVRFSRQIIYKKVGKVSSYR
jgi:ribosomal protein L6P/L9E